MTQDEALNIMKMGTNVFLTGAPGAGKTYVLNQYLDFLYQCGIEVAVTASTGIAATHIGGSTIHSWSGIGIKKYLSDVELDRLSQNERLHNRYQNTKVLVIDEISMLGATQFEMIDTLARKMRRVDAPFGGMQVVLSGDFFQLPPVVRPGDDTRYAFESESWNDLRAAICYLEGSHRHKGNSLMRVLEAIRRKDTEHADVRALFERVRDDFEEGMESITRLYTHNVDVDTENELRLAEIEAEEEKYEMQSRGRAALVKSLKGWCLAPEMLCLKEGAQVMFVKNDPARRYVNGTRGTVVGNENGFPVVETLSGQEIVAESVSWAVEEDGKFAAEIEQVPLRLAWAITVHKSQGMTLDQAHMDLSKSFAPGQGYVALSRVRDLSGLFLKGLSEKALWVDDRAAMVDQEFINRSEGASKRLQEIGDAEILKRVEKFVKSAGGKMPDVKKAGEAGAASRRLRKSRIKDTKPKNSTLDETKELASQKLSIEKIAEKRNLKEATVIAHLEKLKGDGAGVELSHLLPELKGKIKDFGKIQLAFDHLKKFKLSPIKKYLEGKGMDVSFEELRLARLMLPDKKFKSLMKEETSTA